MDLWLNILCRVDKSHVLGVVVRHLEGRTGAGQTRVANGMHWDESGRAVGDCPRCAPHGTGSDQQVSRARIDARIEELLQADRFTGDLQV